MLTLYNTLSEQKEVFKSFDPAGKLARIYVCGVTPYDTSHMGHALVAVVFDTLRRYLLHQGYEVKHVQNLTDVDDDIIKRARRDGVPYDQLGQQWDQLYRDGLASINCLPFDEYVPASSQIESIKKMVKQLIEQNQAYQASDGNVYFRAASFPKYGELGHQSAAEMLEKAKAGAEDSLVDFPGNPAKESDLDFIVWQGARLGEPSWPSEWGEGRPGWHIECSSISTGHLGPQFEIHGGGADLIFPHHNSEIAQSESVTHQAPVVGHWLHVAMLYLDGEKMSKSLGNLILIRDALKTHSANAIRLYLLGAQHYRTPLHYQREDVNQAEEQAQTLQQALQATATGQATGEDFANQFYAALDDDFNTPEAIKVLVALSQAILNGDTGTTAQETLRELSGILGLSLASH